MGYDCSRFTAEISEELLCSICSEVLKDAITTDCEHLFCRQCIMDWLSVNRTCPIDRLYITGRNIRAAPRVIRNLLGKLDIHCDYVDDGCQTIVSLESLEKHVNDCFYNPKKRLICQKGCEKWMTREELKSHNCWNDIRKDMLTQQQTVLDLKRQRSALIFVIIFLIVYILCPSVLFSFYFENLFILMPNTNNQDSNDSNN